MQFVNEISLDLRLRLNDILNGTQNKNDSVYVPIQTYAENLLKIIAKYHDKAKYLDKRTTLGSMLDNKVMLSLLEYDYNLKDLSVLKEINKQGNQYKHNGHVSFDEPAVTRFVSFILNLSVLFYEKSTGKTVNRSEIQFNKQPEVSKQEFDNKITEVVKNEVNIKVDKNDIRIRELEAEINILLSKKKKLELKKSNISITLTADQIEALMRQKNSEIDELEEKLLVEGSQTIKAEIELLTSQVSELEKQLIIVNSSDASSFDIEINKIDIEIRDKRDEINRLTEKRNQIQQVANQITNSPVNAHNAILKQISTSFNSSYSGDSKFSIQGLDDEVSSKLKYRSIYAAIFNQLIRGVKVGISKYLINLELSEEIIDDVYKVEIAILMLIRNGYLDSNQWHLNLTNRDIKILEYAVEDIRYRFDRVTKLTQYKVEPPTFQLINSKPTEDFINISFDTVYPMNSRSFTIQETFSQERLSKIWISDKIKYQIKNQASHKEILNEILMEFFGFPEFRVGQFEILANVLNGNKTIGILTTGGGKSLIYQMTGLMQPKITLIVDPINALIHDQYRKVHNDFGIHRTLKVTNDSRNNISAKEIIRQFYVNPPLFAFSSPQRFQNKEFRDLLIGLNANQSVGLICLDEVHCLSEWGHSFMIPYLMLTHTINTHCENVQYLGLTATAAINVIKDLQVEMGIFDVKNIIFSKKLQRDNLNFSIEQTTGYSHMEMRLKEILSADYTNPEKTFELRGEDSNSVLVFFKTVKELETLHLNYQTLFEDEITKFHGTDKEHQDEFIENRKTLLFTTKSFGMGVDKPNIRKSIHLGMPGSRESFFQEAGRCGRDGKYAECLLLTYENDPSSVPLVNKFLNLNTPAFELIEIQQRIKAKTTDLSTNAYFMASDIESVEYESEKATQMFKLIIQKTSNLKFQLSVVDTRAGNELHKAQKVLYVLHKVGVIRNWEVQYLRFDVSSSSVLLNVSVHPEYQNFDHIKISAMNYLTQYSQNKVYTEKIEKLQKMEDFYQLIFTIREWYHNTFIRSRREQLANMVDFINRYKNNNKNKEIQDELSQFFDISRLIERFDSNKSLRFENTEIKDVVKRAAQLKGKELQEIRINMDRLLETDESTNINIFTSLVYLKSDLFESRNGRERFEYTYRNLAEEDKKEMYRSMSPIYQACDEGQKHELLKFLLKQDREKFYDDLFEEDYMDDQVAVVMIQDINSRFSDIL